jgi:hypothetical protein
VLKGCENIGTIGTIGTVEAVLSVERGSKDGFCSADGIFNDRHCICTDGRGPMRELKRNEAFHIPADPSSFLLRVTSSAMSSWSLSQTLDR